MKQISTAFFQGDSEEKYKFTIYQWDTIFSEGFSGVYIFAKRFKDGENFTVQPYFIGHMDNLFYLQGYHPKMDCALKNGANCKCILSIKDPKQRLAITEDLIDAYDPPCNR